MPVVLLNKKEARRLKLLWSSIGGNRGRYDDQECMVLRQPHRSYKLNKAQLEAVKKSSGRSKGKRVKSKKYGERLAFAPVVRPETSRNIKRSIELFDNWKEMTPRQRDDSREELRQLQDALRSELRKAEVWGSLQPEYYAAFASMMENDFDRFMTTRSLEDKYENIERDPRAGRKLRFN